MMSGSERKMATFVSEYLTFSSSKFFIVFERRLIRTDLVFLTMPTWMSIRAAIRQSKPLVISIKDNFQFCLEYASHETKKDKTKPADVYALASMQRLHLGSDDFGSKNLPPGRQVFTRQVLRESCETCKLTRDFEANLSASTEKETKSTSQSSVSKQPKAQTVAPSTMIESIQRNADRGCDKCSLLCKGIKSHLVYYDGQETGTIYFSGDKTRLYCTIALKQGWAPVLEFVSFKGQSA
jgi:hypothetical protein